MAKKNYSEKEVAQIFKRAAELESKQSNDIKSVEGGPGLSLDELSQIAVDAGLDPENVRRAASELSLSESTDSQAQNTTVQKNEVIAERWVNGEFSNEAADLVIADLNHRYNATHEKVSWMDNIMHDASLDTDQQSKVKRTGKSLEWQKLNEYGTEEIRVLVQPRNEKIRIRVTKKNVYGTSFADQDAVSGFLPYIPYLAGVILLFALPNSLFFNAIFALIGFFAVKFLISKNADTIKKKFSDSKKNTLDKYQTEIQTVARDLAGLIGQSQPETLVSSKNTSKNEAPSITLDDIEMNNADSSDERESDPQKKRDRS